MGQKYMFVALLFEIQSVKILQKLTVYLQIHLLTNVSVLFHAHQVSVYLRMHWKNYLHFVFPQVEVGEYSVGEILSCLSTQPRCDPYFLCSGLIWHL